SRRSRGGEHRASGSSTSASKHFPVRIMNQQNRRAFLQLSVGMVAAGLSPLRTDSSGSVVSSLSSAQSAPALAANQGKKPLRLGLIIGIGSNPDAAMAKVHDLGLPTCQAHVGKITPDLAGSLREALDKYQIEATSLVVGGPGKEIWDFY